MTTDQAYTTMTEVSRTQIASDLTTKSPLILIHASTPTGDRYACAPDLGVMVIGCPLLNAIHFGTVRDTPEAAIDAYLACDGE